MMVSLRGKSQQAHILIDSSGRKAAQPELFSGEKARLVNDWLAAVKRYLMLSGVEETKWIAYAVTMLTSTALSWWNSVELSNSEKSILDYGWSEFVDLVRERFVPVSSEAVAMSKISQWKQTGSVASYISQFQNFEQLILKDRLDEESYPKFSQHTSTRINQTRVVNQLEDSKQPSHLQ